MSAIQRDREIAAKATGGEWSVVNLSKVACGDYLIENRVDAEHIVRLHNRQPLYDALVDAVNSGCKVECNRASVGKCPAIVCLDRETNVDRALAALDTE